MHGHPKLGLGGRGRVLLVMSLKFEKQPHESSRVVVQCDEVLRVCENQINRDDASCSGDISHRGQKDCTSPPSSMEGENKTNIYRMTNAPVLFLDPRFLKCYGAWLQYLLAWLDGMSRP